MPKLSSAISSGFEQQIQDITAKENASIDECMERVGLLTKIYKEIENTKQNKQATPRLPKLAYNRPTN
jgi:hypothetical protein